MSKRILRAVLVGLSWLGAVVVVVALFWFATFSAMRAEPECECCGPPPTPTMQEAIEVPGYAYYPTPTPACCSPAAFGQYQAGDLVSCAELERAAMAGLLDPPRKHRHHKWRKKR